MSIIIYRLVKKLVLFRFLIDPPDETTSLTSFRAIYRCRGTRARCIHSTHPLGADLHARTCPSTPRLTTIQRPLRIVRPWPIVAQTHVLLLLLLSPGTTL